MDRTAALVSAFELIEAVQGERRDTAAAAIPAAEAAAEAWPDVRFLLATARTVHAIVGPASGADLGGLTEQLLDEAPGPAAAAIALGLQALVAAGTGDTARLLAATSRAIALLDDEVLPPRERCLALVINAAALNTLRLWELVDELYAAALAGLPRGDGVGQAEAVAINRVIIGLEHGLALLECDETEAAAERLRAAAALVPAALATDLQPLWRRDALAAADLVRLLLGEPTDVPVEEHATALAAEGDVEVLPMLLAAHALRAWRDHGDSGPAEALGGRISASSGARTFPLWVRAQVLAARAPGPEVEAVQAHGRLIDRLLWEARLAVLSAARAQIEAERRRADHDRLARAVHTDPLTGLHNRRRFDDWLQRPGSGPTALLLIDLDGFKAVNDLHGHACGDEVLRRIGLLLRSLVRPGDLAVRQGGDEFALVLREDDLDEATVLARAEQVARAVREEDWPQLSEGLSVAVSVGAALATADVSGPALYAAADGALYRVKRAGLPPVLEVLNR